MSKSALVINKSDLVLPANPLGMTQVLPIPEGFWGITPELHDRTFCETDETKLQLLPYMTLLRGSEVFSYTRGDGGAEDRLHGKLSIGLGGHVDGFPLPDVGLMGYLQLEAMREYQEEVGSPMLFPPTFTHLIYDPASEVGRVHLGIHCFVQWTGQDMVLEEGQIEKGLWLQRSQLLLSPTYSRLEPWSAAVAYHLLGNATRL